MARARARRGSRVAFKVLFGHDGRPFGVEIPETKERILVSDAPPLAKVRPTVESIDIPLDVIRGRFKNRDICWIHIRCRLIPVPCPA
jgi:hypothetical protein